MRERDRTVEREHALIEATLEALWRSAGVHRVESQLLLLDSPLARKVPFASWFRAFPRRFLEASGHAGTCAAGALAAGRQHHALDGSAAGRFGAAGGGGVSRARR